MLRALLAGHHARGLASNVHSAAAVAGLLSTCHAFHSSSAALDLPSIVSPSEKDVVPATSINGDTQLSSSQLESLAIFRRFNIAMPQLRGQVILAKVLRSTPRQVLVDPGYYGLNWVSRQELASATAYTASGRPIQRTSTDIYPGEYVKLRLSYYNTPYGDAQLDPVGIPHDVRQKLVWDELQQRMKSGRMVMGRILNPTVKGYAVGVAGYVALLEHGHALPETARQIGTLQPFYVASMDRARRLMKLSVVKRDNMEDMYRQSL